MSTPAFGSPSFGLTTTLAGSTLEAAIERTRAALATEGFGVLTEIDIAKTLKAKLDVDHPPYVILGACMPKLAHQALMHNPAIGLLLPCNVVVAQAGDDAVVSAIDPIAMFSVVEGDDMAPIAEDVKARLSRVIAALK